MLQKALTVLGALLIAGSVIHAASASERHHQNWGRVPKGIGEQFRNASNSIAQQARGWCSQVPGNPYNKETDYEGWSAWRASGSWDSRNDC